MRRSDFDRSVRQGFHVLLDLGITSWDRQVSLRSMDPTEDYRRIAFSPDVEYEDIFRAGLRYRAYNFLLEDYSYFQFWCESGRLARRLRYAYCPNPFEWNDLEDELARITELFTDMNVYETLHQLLQEAPLKIGRPPIRYDLAMDERHQLKHPAAHLTVGGHRENRWPVCRVLTPKLFVLFVSKHYYGEQWSAQETGQNSTDRFINPYDQALADEKRASTPLDEESFSLIERSHLYID